MRILGIDPGTHCGWALRDDSGSIFSGVWHLKGKRVEGAGMRFLKMRVELLNKFSSREIDVVFYEEVRNHKGTAAAHIYGGIVAVITSVCEEFKIPYESIPVGTVKKFATGKGNAGKPQMIASAEKKWPDAKIEDDNEADARWIVECGHSQLNVTASTETTQDDELAFLQ